MFRGSDDNQLACMDMIGNIRVFSIFEANGELKYPFLLNLQLYAFFSLLSQFSGT